MPKSAKVFPIRNQGLVPRVEVAVSNEGREMVRVSDLKPGMLFRKHKGVGNWNRVVSVGFDGQSHYIQAEQQA